MPPNDGMPGGPMPGSFFPVCYNLLIIKTILLFYQFCFNFFNNSKMYFISIIRIHQ
jgi:hypothetical protein